MYLYIHYIYIWRDLIGCFDECLPQQLCTPTFALTRFEYMHACIRPIERSEACSERSDEGRHCKLHITQNEKRTSHRLKAVRGRD